MLSPPGTARTQLSASSLASHRQSSAFGQARLSSSAAAAVAVGAAHLQMSPKERVDSLVLSCANDRARQSRRRGPLRRQRGPLW